MKLEPIVVSLLDTDLYKFNMDQVISISIQTCADSISSSAATRMLFLPRKWPRRSAHRWITSAH